MKRRLICVVLAVILCLALAVPAFAAGGGGAQAFNPTALIICLLIGFVLALIPMGVLKGQINNVHSKTEATSYTREGSLDLMSRDETFLFKNVQRVPIPRNNTPNNNGR